MKLRRTSAAARKRSSAQEARRRERGSIAVGGLFMIAFLAGAVFYSSSMSHTAIHREGLQQSADSAVFSESVMASRGMNMIAAMNVIMVGLNANQLPVRVMTPSYAKIAAMSCGSPCTCAIKADAQRALSELGRVSKHTEQRIGDVHQSLSDAQNAIARMVPQLAEQSAGKAAKENPEFVKQPQAKIYTSSLGPTGCRKGLPVQDDTFQTVCTRAKKYTPDLAFKLSDDRLDTIKGSCKSGLLAMMDATPNFPTVDQAYCWEAQRESEQGKGVCEGGAHPKKVLEGAKNGTDHMQFWAQVDGAEMTETKHAIDNFQDTQPATERADANLAFAQSETYFDTTTTWDEANQPSPDEREQTMYDTRWTARLRRVRVPAITFPNDRVVKQQMADPKRWAQKRQELFRQRQQFWASGPTSRISNLLMSSEEGPLQ